jgi:tetratricopeptide (TPR) repeat protein
MKKINLLVALLFVGASLFAQKSNITNAHNKLKEYKPIDGEIEANKKALSEAKAAIDLAAVNTETSAAPDMHRYRAIIYFTLREFTSEISSKTGFKPDSILMDEYDKVIKESCNFLISSVQSGKIKNEKKIVLEYLKLYSDYAFLKGDTLLKKKDYQSSIDYFLNSYRINNYTNSDIDAKRYLMYAYTKSMDTLMDQKKFIDANDLGNRMMKEFPNNINILIPLINNNLEKNDIENTEKYVKLATEIDSTNKTLFYVLGTSLANMKQYERAATALEKALKLDSNYAEAVYQYCSIMFNSAVELRGNASDLKINDPKAKLMEEQALNNLNTSLKYLEPFLIANPMDKTALEIGWRTYSYLDQTDKSAELKKRWEAIK